MGRIVMNYELAMAIMKDYANASMRKHGRTHWNREDYNAGARKFNEVFPEERGTTKTAKACVSKRTGKHVSCARQRAAKKAARTRAK